MKRATGPAHARRTAPWRTSPTPGRRRCWDHPTRIAPRQATDLQATQHLRGEQGLLGSRVNRRHGGQRARGADHTECIVHDGSVMAVHAAWATFARDLVAQKPGLGQVRIGAAISTPQVIQCHPPVRPGRIEPVHGRVGLAGQGQGAQGSGSAVKANPIRRQARVTRFTQRRL